MNKIPYCYPENSCDLLDGSS